MDVGKDLVGGKKGEKSRLLGLGRGRVRWGVSRVLDQIQTADQLLPREVGQTSRVLGRRGGFQLGDGVGDDVGD
jgi:hypothetical protein